MTTLDTVEPGPNQSAATDPIERLRSPLTTLIEQHIVREVSSERPTRYLQIRRVDSYMKGNQFGTLSMDSATGMLDFGGQGLPFLTGLQGAEATGMYDYNFDVVESYGNKYAALLGNRPLYNAVAAPRNPTRQHDRDAARAANTLREWFSSCWDIPTKNIEYFARQWDSGEVYGYLQYVADERQFGRIDVPQYEPKLVTIEPGGFLCRNCGTKSDQPQYLDATDIDGTPTQEMACAACGSGISDLNWQEPVTVEVPEFVGTAKFPQAGPRLTLTTGIAVTIPPDTKDKSDLPYLLYEYEEHKGVLLDYFGQDLRKMMDVNTGSVRGGRTDVNGLGRQVRMAEASIRAVTLPSITDRWTFTRCWLRPSMYEYLSDENLRVELKSQYPNGAKLSMVDGVLIRVEPEDLREVWVIGVPKPGKTLVHKPLAWAVLGHQDAINDLGNIMIAILERALPTYGYRSDMFSREAITQKASLPAEAIPVNPSYGGRLEDGIVKLPTASFPDQAMPLGGWITSNIEQHTGLLPAAWGGGGGASRKTGVQVQQELQQALQVLATPATFASRFWAEVFDLAVRLVARYAEQDIEVSISKGGVSTSEQIDLAALRQGEWVFKCDPGIPMSLSERQSRIETLISQSPGAAIALGLVPPEGQMYENPANAQAAQDYLLPGMTDLQVPGSAEWNYTAQRIEELLQGQPIVGPDGVEQPSQMPEEFVVNYAVEARNVAQWCLSQPGQAIKQSNKLAYRNVVLYGKECDMRAQPPTPPPGQNQPGGTPPPAEQIGVNNAQ